MSKMIIVDANGNEIVGASVKRLPSAEVQARKAARKLVGLSDRGRIPETVVGLMTGKVSPANLRASVDNLRDVLGTMDGLTDTEYSAVVNIHDTKVTQLGIYDAMQEHNITLDDLTKGDADDDEPAGE